MEDGTPIYLPERDRVSLDAQRRGLVASLEMHILRSEDLAAKVAEIDRELAELNAGGDT